MELKCKHCNHEWNYQGLREYVTTCPNCQYKVYINWDAEQLELIRQLKREIRKEKEKGEGDEQVNNIGEDEV